MAVTSSVAGVARAVTSSAATSATTPSAKPAYVEISAARSSPTSSMQVACLWPSQPKFCSLIDNVIDLTENTAKNHIYRNLEGKCN